MNCGIGVGILDPINRFRLRVRDDARPVRIRLQDPVPTTIFLSLDKVFLSHEATSWSVQPRRPGLACYYFFFFGAWARSEAMGPRSRFGVFELRRSLPACDAVRFDVAILNLFC